MSRDPRANERALREVAADQGGYFTAGQALAVGYTYRQQHFHRQRGNWLRIDRGLFRFPDFPTTPHESLIRWSLWSRDQQGRIQAVISHESALVVHELSDVMPRRIHLTVPRSFRKRTPKNVALHRGGVPAADREQHMGFLVTTPRRTLLDMAEGELSSEHLLAAVRDGIDRGAVRLARLRGAKLSPWGRRRLTAALVSLAEPERPRYRTPAAFRRALEDRLRDRAESTGEDLTRLRRLVAFDRLLARLFAEGASSPWVVKGGFGLEIRYALAARTTKDLDLCLRTQGSRQGETGRDDVLDLLRRAAELDLDGFVVRVLAPGKVRQSADPRSFRFPVEVLLAGRPFARFHLDVGIGHVRKETVDWIMGTDYLTFAEIPPTRLGIVSVEQQIAEKLHALTRPRRRGTNTRVKDLVDLAVLVERENPASGVVEAALKSTFSTYSTHPMPRDLPPPPESWTGPYAALANEVGVSAGTLHEACRLLGGFWKRVIESLRST